MLFGNAPKVNRCRVFNNVGYSIHFCILFPSMIFVLDIISVILLSILIDGNWLYSFLKHKSIINIITLVN